jgi:hypothetical protein
VLPNDPIKYDRYFERRIKPVLDRPIGLFLFTIILFSIIVFILNYSNFDLIDSLWQIFVLSFIISIFIWLYIRRIPKFSGNEVGILTSLFLINHEADKELTLLYKKLQSVIDREALSTEVKLKFLPPRLIPKNDKEAHELRKKTNALLIIWGDVDTGNIDSEKQTVFRPIYFSYSMNLPKDKVEIFNRNFSGIIAKRRWIISENNNVVEREYLAQNLEEISFYIIGLVLFFFRLSNKSLELLKIALTKYENKQLSTNDDKIAVANIKIAIAFIYSYRIKSLELAPTCERRPDHLKIASELIKELDSLKFYAPSHLLTSIIKFYESDIPSAIEYAIKSEKYSGPDDSAPQFSLAFLYFYVGDLNNGVIRLQKALKCKRLYEIGDQSMSLIRWYEDTYNKDKTKTYFNYPLGILYYELSGDKILAKECFETFIGKYTDSNDRIIKQMFYETEKRLKKIHSV